MLQSRPPDGDAKVVIGDLLWYHGVRDPLVSRVVDPRAGSEWPLVFVTLGALVDQRTLFARKRLFVFVALDQVLADLRADAFEQKTHVPDDGIVPQDRRAWSGRNRAGQGPQTRQRMPRGPVPTESRPERQATRRSAGRKPKKQRISACPNAPPEFRPLPRRQCKQVIVAQNRQ